MNRRQKIYYFYVDRHKKGAKKKKFRMFSICQKQYVRCVFVFMFVFASDVIFQFVYSGRRCCYFSLNTFQNLHKYLYEKNGTYVFVLSVPKKIKRLYVFNIALTEPFRSQNVRRIFSFIIDLWFCNKLNKQISIQISEFHFVN